MRSFGWFFESAAHDWANAADLIIKVAKNHPQMHIVRYEDLLDSSRKNTVLRNIFQFIGVDADSYDYEIDVGVIGSSTYFEKNKGLNWDQIKKTSAFNPLNRWEHWSRYRHQRFNWLAGEQSKILGYELVNSRSLVGSLYNGFYDLLWPIRKKSRTAARKFLPQNLRGKILWSRGKRYRSKVVQN
jgi:hypothetical protein